MGSGQRRTRLAHQQVRRAVLSPDGLAGLMAAVRTLRPRAEAAPPGLPFFAALGRAGLPQPVHARPT